MFSIKNLNQSISKELSNLFADLDKLYCVFLTSYRWIEHEPSEQNRCVLFSDKPFKTLQEAYQFAADFLNRNLDKEFIKEAKSHFKEFEMRGNLALFATKGNIIYELHIDTIAGYIQSHFEAGYYYFDEKTVEDNKNVANFLSEINLAP